MNTKLKNLLLLGTFFLGFQFANAQDQPTQQQPRHSAEERAVKFSEELKNKLALTEDQTQKIKSIILEREKSRDEMKNQRRKRAEELKEILTTEQMATFRKIQKERKTRMQERRRQHHQE